MDKHIGGNWYATQAPCLTWLSMALLIGLGTLVPTLPSVAVEFSLPGDAAPRQSSGGGSRGDVEFALPGAAAPPRSSGGGSRGNINFALPGASVPRNSASGGSRMGKDDALSRGTRQGPPQASLPPLTALLPSSNLGLTLSARPRLYVYMPPLDTDQAYFSLKDESGVLQYEEILAVKSGGIVAIDIPTTVPALVLDHNYLWYFSPIETGTAIPLESYEVSGWVKRVEPSQTLSSVDHQTILAHNLGADEAIQQAARYADAGLWYDTLTMLELAQQVQPEDPAIRQEWQDLLIQVGLASLAEQYFSR